MHVSNAAERTIAPYNTAYLRDDRSYLYEDYDIDHENDAGVVHPETGERDVPPDYAERRRAILAFYGHRCGRCLREIAETGTADAGLGYLYSVAAATGEGDRWALESLVAVCEPCYEVLHVTDPDRLDAFGSAYRRSQQFPQWLGDPRVAVERIPLTGRELWLRETLERELGEDAAAKRDSADREESINGPVATSACLARSTPAAEAVALGEALAADAWQPMPSDQRLTERWAAVPDDERAAYDRRARHWRAFLESEFVPARE